MTEQEYDSFLIQTNKVGAKNLRELNQIERDLTQLRAKELSLHPIAGQFNYKHLKQIHKFIFQDVYTWAGKDRNETGIIGNFYKGSSVFVPADKLGKYADEIFTELKENNYLKDCKSIDEFSSSCAELFANLNALHPFREGNGRTQRIFLNQLADNAGYKLDLNLVSKENMIMASIDANRLSYDRIRHIIKANYEFVKNELESKRQDDAKSVLARLGETYTKKVESGAIKAPEKNEKSKSKDR